MSPGCEDRPQLLQSHRREGQEAGETLAHFTPQCWLGLGQVPQD
jgi:hypothetical protein